MKRFNWTLFIVLIIWSCSNKNNTNKLEQTDSKKTVIDCAGPINPNIDTLLFAPSDICCQPCIEIQEFVEEIDGLGWIPDTSRLKKVGIYSELNRKQVQYFNNRPFYRIYFEKSDLFECYNYEPIRIITDSIEAENDRIDSSFRSPIEMVFDSVDIELFRSAKSIWAYFYRKKDAVE